MKQDAGVIHDSQPCIPAAYRALPERGRALVRPRIGQRFVVRLAIAMGTENLRPIAAHGKFRGARPSQKRAR